MRRNKKENMWNQAQRFSIRKFSFGVTSVLLGTVFLANTAMADEASRTSNDSRPTTVDTRDGAAQPAAKPAQPVQPAKPVGNVEQPVQPTPPAVQPIEVKKDALTKLVDDFSALLGKVDRERVTKTSSSTTLLKLENLLSKAKAVLQNESATQAEVDAAYKGLKGKVFIAESFTKQEIPKTVAEIKKSLELVKKDLQEYLNKLETATDKTNVVAKEMLASISTQLENASATVEELTTLLKQATPVRNTLVNEVLRASNGSNSPLNGKNMGEGISDLRSAPIDTATSRGNLGIVVANSGFITGYATPSSTIEIKRNGTTVLTSKLDDTGTFKLNAKGIAVGDNVELVVNGKSVYTTRVSTADTVAFNDSLAGIAQVDGYTAAEADVEVTVGGKTFKTKSQTNGYFTINVDTDLMVKDAVVTTVIKKNGQEVGRGTSTVRATKVTDFGVGWIKNPMIDYSHRDVYSPDTKQYAFVSKGTADKAYENIRVYREERIEKDGNKYYYWMLDSGPAANGLDGISKKISLAIPRTVGDPYEFTYTKYQDGKQTFHKKYDSASAWEYEHSAYRAYVKNGVPRSGATYGENIDAWMDYINPSNTWWWNIYRNSSKDGTD